MVRKTLLRVGGGVGGGVRKKILTSRGKAEGLYEFSKIENRRFFKSSFFHIISDGNEMECLISQEDSNLDSAQVNFSIASFISGKTTYYWRGSIYCKNPKTYVTHYTVVLNNNMLLCFYFVQNLKNIKLKKKKSV